jgi:hypothetical protein
VIQQFVGDLGLESHWAVVIVVATAFLILQIALSLRVYWRARAQERVLLRLRRDIDRGGDGRSGIDDVPESFSWLGWVDSIFPAGGSRTASFNRDAVLHELDAHLASDSSFLLLQRMGIMAPLLGVVLTVIGFYWLEVDEAEAQSLGSILLAVTPLVSGVGAGAVLALVNQGLLQVVGGRIDRVRMAARSWFDVAIWRRQAGDAQGSTSDAVAAIERFARIVGESADRHAASFGRIDESTASMRQAAAQFRDVVSSFHGEIKGVPQALNVLQDAMAASARALQELIPVGARAIANLDVSVAAFRSTIDQEFTGAAKLHHSSSKSLSQAVSQIAESTDLLKSSSDEMQKSLEAMSGTAGGLEDAGVRLQRTIEKDTAPAQRTMHDAAAAFAKSAGQLTEFIEQGIAPATQQLAGLHETLAGMEEAVESIKQFSQSRADVDRLTASLAQSAGIAEAIAGLPEQIRGLLEESAARQAETLQARNRKPWLGNRPR